MSKKIVECIMRFSDDLSANGYELREMTMELPYHIRLKLNDEILEQMYGFQKGAAIGRSLDFILNTRHFPITITSLKSEREEALKQRLSKLEVRRTELDKEEKEIKEQLGL